MNPVTFLTASKSNLHTSLSLSCCHLRELVSFVRPIVRWLNAQFRPDRDKSDKSTKFGTQFAYTLPNDIRRGAHVNLVMLPF